MSFLFCLWSGSRSWQLVRFGARAVKAVVGVAIISGRCLWSCGLCCGRDIERDGHGQVCLLAVHQAGEEGVEGPRGASFLRTLGRRSCLFEVEAFPG